MAAAVCSACGNAGANQAGLTAPASSVRASPTLTAIPSPTDQVPPIVNPSLDLRAGPVDVPLELRIPAIRLHASVLGVGITPKNVMDTPTGRAGDAVWQKVFWYRGGGAPGSASTVTIAGHVDDVLGRPAIFAHLTNLRPGDPIIVHDLRTDLDINYVVTGNATYTIRQTLDPTVLAKIYGPGPVAGQGPQPSSDGLSYLTLITCIGNWVTSAATYDHRFAVYAVSAPPPFAPRRPHSEPFS